MTEYRVKWEIDVEAATPEHAARLADEIMRDPGSMPPVFDVIAPDGVVTRIDIDDVYQHEGGPF